RYMAAMAAMPAWSWGVHSVGWPSVAITAMGTCPGWAMAHVFAWSRAPWSAGAVGVLVLGMCMLSELEIAGPTPGSGAISTSGTAEWAGLQGWRPSPPAQMPKPGMMSMQPPHAGGPQSASTMQLPLLQVMPPPGGTPKYPSPMEMPVRLGCTTNEL